jgi:hypothetical protein
VPIVPFSQYGQATAAGDGTATVFVPGPRLGVLSIGQVILSGTPAGGAVACVATIYRSAIIPGQIMGRSLIANADTLVGHPGDELTPGDQLVAVFSGLAAASFVSVNMRGREVY